MSDHLINMRLSRKQSNDEIAISSPKGPRFPYGLQISLDDDSLKKLGFDELPAIGTKMIVVGVGKVTRASENRSQDGIHRDVSIQLERIEVEPLDDGSDHTAVEAVSKAIKDV